MTKPKTMQIFLPDEDVMPIPGFEGLYSITRQGKVWSHGRTLIRKNGASVSLGNKWLKNSTINTGYFYVNLYRGMGLEKKLIHRLVALAWIPSDDPLRDEVNHKDGVRKNNDVSNLEWCTCSENHQHAWQSGLRSKSQKQVDAGSAVGKRSRFFVADQVLSIRALHGAGICQRAIAKQFNVTPGAINKVVHKHSYSEI